jgi:iduronate 2-sulfatase
MALSQWPRDRFKNRHRGHGDIMGYSLRTKRYRYIEWRDWKSSKPLKRELYDHQKDPEEMVNIANEAGNTQLIISLRAKLNKKLN